MKKESARFGSITGFQEVDITEFADWDARTGKISIKVPVVEFESGLCRDEAIEGLRNKFGVKTADEMIDATYEAIHKISVQKWVAEVLLKN